MLTLNISNIWRSTSLERVSQTTTINLRGNFRSRKLKILGFRWCVAFFHDRCYFSLRYVIKLTVLEHIHSHDIVHRDIKPRNILAREGTDFLNLYLIDFGLARRRLSGTPREADLVKERINVLGTLSWASLNALNGIGELVPWSTISIL